jgi:hypothetical protein
MMYLLLMLLMVLGCLSSEDISAMQKNNEVPQVRDHAQFLQNPFEVTDSFIDGGRTIYVKNCIGCHGAGGEEPFYHSIKYHANRHTYGDYLWVVTYGLESTNMPSFKEKLTLEERWKVITYLKKKLAWSLEGTGVQPSFSSLDLSIYDLDKLFSDESTLTAEEKKDAWSEYSGKKVTWKGQVAQIDLKGKKIIKVKIRHKPQTKDYDVLLVFDTARKEEILKIKPGEYVAYTGILKDMPEDGSSYVLEGVAIESAKITSD